MKINTEAFCAEEGKTVRLKDWPTKVEPLYRSKKDYERSIEDHVGRLRSLQDRLYASNSHAVLLIFQAMDAAGKDGAIKHVMSGVNPQGCQVFSFKHPSAAELEHDFLWRTTACLPERGRIGIFNRSYYEEVLIVRVHKAILESESIPPDGPEARGVWEGRYRSIVDLEDHLYRNGTRIVKFFLHLSKAEQRRRFIERIDDPSKNWKFSEADIAERRYWKRYMAAYEDCISATSTARAPWHIVPADDKQNARLIISQVVLELMEGLDLRYPKVGKQKHRELLEIRKGLARHFQA